MIYAIVYPRSFEELQCTKMKLSSRKMCFPFTRPLWIEWWEVTHVDTPYCLCCHFERDMGWTNYITYMYNFDFFIRPLRDDEKLPVRTHRIVFDSATGEGDGEEKPRRKHKKAKEKDKEDKKKHRKDGKEKVIYRTTVLVDLNSVFQFPSRLSNSLEL